MRKTTADDLAAYDEARAAYDRSLVEWLGLDFSLLIEVHEEADGPTLLVTHVGIDRQVSPRGREVEFSIEGVGDDSTVRCTSTVHLDPVEVAALRADVGRKPPFPMDPTAAAWFAGFRAGRGAR